jgi:hypothetical protein
MIYKSTIESLVQDAMFGLVKMKTGITSHDQIKSLEFFTTYKKTDGIIKISSIFLKKRLFTDISRISDVEVKLCGSTNNEFIEFLRHKGAHQIIDKKSLLEKI